MTPQVCGNKSAARACRDVSPMGGPFSLFRSDVPPVLIVLERGIAWPPNLWRSGIQSGIEGNEFRYRVALFFRGIRPSIFVAERAPAKAVGRRGSRVRRAGVRLDALRQSRRR